MQYIKKNTPFMRFPAKYHQNFIFNPQEIPNRALIVAMYMNNQVDDYDLDILEFLVNCTFATKHQILRFCGGNNIEYGAERIENLFKNRLLNKFALVEDKKYNDKHPSDAEEIHCLAEGGKILIETYRDSTLCWDFSRIASGSKAIAKGLIDTELWLDIQYNTNVPLLSYEKYPAFYINSKVVSFGSHCRFKVGQSEIGQPYCAYMIIEAYRGDDDILALRKRFLNLAGLIAGNYWRKYYPDTKEAPMLLIVVENDDMAMVVAKEITGYTNIKDTAFRLTTSERLMQGIQASNTFLKYDKEKDALYETSMKIFQ